MYKLYFLLIFLFLPVVSLAAESVSILIYNEVEDSRFYTWITYDNGDEFYYTNTADNLEDFISEVSMQTNLSETEIETTAEVRTGSPYNIYGRLDLEGTEPTFEDVTVFEDGSDEWQVYIDFTGRDDLTFFVGASNNESLVASSIFRKMEEALAFDLGNLSSSRLADYIQYYDQDSPSSDEDSGFFDNNTEISFVTTSEDLRLERLERRLIMLRERVRVLMFLLKIQSGSLRW